MSSNENSPHPAEHYQHPEESAPPIDRGHIGAGMFAYGATTVGSMALMHNSQVSYLKHTYTVAALEGANEEQLAQYSEMPPMVKMSVEGVALRSKIDTIATSISDEKYSYEGGMSPSQVSGTSLVLGVVAGLMAVKRYKRSYNDKSRSR